MEQELLDLVLAEGILRATEARPIFRVDGSTGPWMLNTLDLSLTARGARLAARALLKKLKRFEGRTLATYGTTGLPLMQAVIAESKGAYTGLLIRKDIKPHGARLRIQGPPSRGPVILLDDSLSSGTALRAGLGHLREAGREVEGAVVLVRFGYDGVAALLAEERLPVEAVFDTERDLRPRMPDEGDLPWPNPGRWFPDFAWSRTRAPEGLHPAVLARRAIESWLTDRTLPRPPRTLDRRYDGAGGIFVSLRAKADIHDRPARDGFWHFPEETWGPLPEELMRASVRAAHTLETERTQPRAVLDACACAVTFFSALAPVPVGALDNARYGIVVRSTERVGVMGGALPNMPGIINDWRQFRHAAFKNGQLYPDEPYELLRHDVVKVVEPGFTDWQRTGVVKARPADLSPLARLAWEWVRFHQELGPKPRASKASVAGFAQVFVTVYVGGALAGCRGMAVDASTDVNALLDALGAEALADERFSHRTTGPATVVLSLLTHDIDLGEHTADAVMAPTRFADQALEVRQGAQAGLLLPMVAVTHDYTPDAYAEAVVAKSGIVVGPQTWTRFDCTSLVADSDGVRRLVDALPQRTPADGNPRALGRLWADFLAAHATKRGPAVSHYRPFQDEQLLESSPEWLAHAAWVKARVGLDARADLKRLALGEASWTTLAFAALAHDALGEPRRVKPIAAVLRKFGPVDDDYTPGQVLYALARVARDADVTDLLGHYRRRFRARPAWGSVAWLTMAFTAWGQLDFAWEIAAWALQSQGRDGGFLNDHQPDAPGALTAVYLEGFAVLLAALKRARRTRQARILQRALARGFHFLARLTYLPGDAGMLPNPAYAVGGVRNSLTSGEVRLDFVQHALSAVLLHP